MSATKKQMALTQRELMINSINPDFAPPATSGDSKGHSKDVPGSDRAGKAGSITAHRSALEPVI